MNTSELQKAVMEYQEGTPSNVQNETDTAVAVEQYDPQTEYVRALLSNDVTRHIPTVNTDEARAAGYGTSRFDRFSYMPGMDLEDSRAKEQPGLSKIGAGLAKGTVRTVTSAVNTVLGTLAGVGYGIAEPILDIDSDGKRGVGEAIMAASNNPVSQWLVSLEDGMEQVVPNHRTAEERTDEYQRGFYKPSHFLSPNGIADFLSNFGFTLGSMGAGALVGRGLGRVMSGKLSGDVMKGVAVASAEGDAKSLAELQRISQELKNGNITTVNGETLTKNIRNVAKRMNNASARLQLYGATVGAIGEGSFEGLMAKNEFLEEYNAKLYKDFIDNYTGLENEIKEEGDIRYVDNLTGELTELGRERLLDSQRLAVERYSRLKDNAESEGDRLAAITQFMNIPILTVSNVALYGRMLAGGWKTNRANAGKISGKFSTNGAKSPYAAIGGTAKLTTLNALKTMATESAEEMIQGYLSSGTKAVADASVSSFNDAGYDLGAIRAFSSDFFRVMNDAGQEYLGDWKNWQEGFLGAMTGLLGIPGKRWGGGVVGAYQEAKEEINARRQAANKLNSLVNSDEFHTRWTDYIRHMKYSRELDEALAEDNEYAWHTADDNQLIGDVIAFANAGKLNDLYDIADHYANLSDNAADELRAIQGDGTGGNRDKNLENTLDPEVVEAVREQANTIKDAITEYKDLYESIAAIAPQDASSDYLRELVATGMQINRYDNRFLKMLEEVLPYAEIAAQVAASKDKDGNLVSKEAYDSIAQDLFRQYKQAIAGSLLPTNLSFLQKSRTDALEKLDEAVKNNPEVAKKLSDMRKVSDARQEFYKKFKYLQTEKGAADFVEEKVDQVKVDEAAEQASNKIETDSLDSLDKIKDAYFTKDNNDKMRFLGALYEDKDRNPNAKLFLDIKRKFDEFSNYFNEHIPQTGTDKVAERMRYTLLVEDILGRAESISDIENLPDTVFRSASDYIRDTSNTTMGGLPTQSLDDYLRHIEAIRGAMRDFKSLDSQTASRNILAQPETTNIAKASVEQQIGRDAPQPGSEIAKPIKKEEYAAAVSKESLPEQVVEILPENAISAETAEVAEVTVTSNAVTGNELAADNISTYSTDTAEIDAIDSTSDRKGRAKPKKLFYRTSVPEIDSGQAAAARKAISDRDRRALENCDLSDFFRIETVTDGNGKETIVKVNPEYEEIWSALSNAGAFSFVANKLSVGSKDNPVYIEFIKDKNFPQYKGKDEILIAVTVNGNRQILSTLSHQTLDYFGLEALRKAIDEESKNWDWTNGAFVFSKKAKLIAKRQGLIDYDFSGTGEKPIQDIREYSEDAPIVFVDGNGKAIFIGGNTDDIKMPISLLDSSMNRGEVVKEIDRRGALYYLTNSGDGTYIPIRLGVEHFKEENKNSDNPIFEKIRDSIEKIANITWGTTASNVSEQGSSLAKEVAELGKILDIHDVDVLLRDFGGDTGIALAINTNKVNNSTGEAERVGIESKMFRPDQITYEKLRDFIASLGRSLNIKYNTSTGKVSNVQSLLDNRLITSNAKMMRVKGADFYFTAFNPQTGEFFDGEPLVSQIVEPIQEESADVEPQIIPENDIDDEMPVAKLSDIGGIGFDSIHSIPMTPIKAKSDSKNAAAAVSSEGVAVGEEASEQRKLLSTPFEELPKSIKDVLEKKGYSSGEFDSMSNDIKERILSCITI